MDAKGGKVWPLGIFEISHGTAAGSLVSPRSIFMRLCLLGATQFVMVHNHPSGVPEVSRDDVKTTQSIIDAGHLMDIPMQDHIIIGTESFISMKRNSL